MPDDPRRGILWALGSATCIAAFAIPWKIASGIGQPITNTLLLLVSAALFTSVLTVTQQRAVPSFSGLDLRVACALAVCTLAGNFASANAIGLISPSLLTVVQRGEVIIVALLAWPILGERVDWRFWLGAVVAAAGLLLLQRPETEGLTHREAGIAWAIAAAFCFGSMAVITRRVVHRIDVVSVNALRLWISVGFWFVWNGLPDALFRISAEQAGFVALTAFFGPFAGRLCMMNSARYLEARLTTLATLAAPPLTVLLAFVVLGELPSLREVEGGLLMLIGISIPILGLQRAARREARARLAASGTAGGSG
jgi:drug/metabolite transporter (DMT)-like permease